MTICPTCKGDGTVFVKSMDLTKNPPTKTGFDLPCDTCDGKGEVTKDELRAKAKRLWAELRDIPTNKDDEIDVEWHIFTKGTEREEIWHWFENEFDLSVATDLMRM